MVKEMTNEEAWKFEEDCGTFKDYKSVSEYIEDIVTCLVYSTWHYTEDRARKRAEQEADYIKRCYSEKCPAADCAVDVGYQCG